MGMVFFALLICYTGSKLVKMAQIRGFIPGPTPVAKTITGKAALPGHYGDAYWVAWDGADVSEPGRNRINLDPEAWERYRVGDEIDVIYFRGDRFPYLRDGIFSNNGNFVFDGRLLTMWLTGFAVFFGFEVAYQRRRKRRQRR